MSALIKAGIDHLSFSSLDKFAGFGSCELAWYYDRIEHQPKRPAGPGMLTGTAWDGACTAAAEHKIDTGENPPSELAAQAFLDTWVEQLADPDREYTLEGEARDEEAKRALDRGPIAARMFAETVIPRIVPVETQRRIEVGFDEVEWTLVGYVDLLEAAGGAELPGVIVTDNKATLSTSRKFDQEKAQGDFQLGLYDLGLTMEGERVLGRGFRSTRILKTKQELGAAFVPSDDAGRDRALALLAATSQRLEMAVETGNFLPTAMLSGSWKCSAKFCDYWDLCPFGRKARTIVGMSVAGEPEPEEAS